MGSSPIGRPLWRRASWTETEDGAATEQIERRKKRERKQWKATESEKMMTAISNRMWGFKVRNRENLSGLGGFERDQNLLGLGFEREREERRAWTWCLVC